MKLTDSQRFYLSFLFIKLLKVICVEHHWSFAEFLRIGSERLDLFPRAVRAFNIDGMRISHFVHFLNSFR